jgi:hypothetical protein
VIGNYIGTNAAGTAAVPNTNNGVAIFNCQNNQIGTSAAGTGNVISGNGLLGGFVDQLTGVPNIDDRPATGNVFAFNRIGTNAAGTAAVGNGNSGLGLSADDNSALDNLVSGNGFAGIFVGQAPGQAPNAWDGNVVQRNRVGTNAAGTAAIGNANAGISIGGASNTTIGGSQSDGNLVSGNAFQGILVAGFAGVATSDTTVVGNLVGTDVTGTLPLGNLGGGATAGIAVGDGTSNTQVSGNVVAAQQGGGPGVALSQVSNGNTGTTVVENAIGSDISHAINLGNSGVGVRVDDVDGATIADNHIAFNGGDGVSLLSGTADNILITANRIRSNGALGIDLNDDGPTPNDGPGDADPGPNGLQNFPVLTSAVFAGGSLTLAGILDGTASTGFSIEVFANTSCDPSNFGEGDNFLGTLAANTDGTGTGPINGVLPYDPVTQGAFITATASDETTTSEFSQCFVPEGLPLAPTTPEIPTLSEVGLAILVLLMVFVAWRRLQA